jgi:cell fate regulator YaaT (PSP1 superfamily)
MGITIASHIVGVRFHKIGKLYHFDASEYPELEPGDFVIVETTRGRQIGQIVGIVEPEKIEMASVKPIKAPATARDLMMKKLWEAKEVEALIICREAAADAGDLMDAKFVKASYSYDGSMLTFLFTSEEENLNTNRLKRKLDQKFHTRLELRRIGARDAAKLLGEYGACGSPRCCSTHLTEFSPISIKMAKAQGISLNPSEITGMCGRLRCCLVYEYEQYVEATRQLPRVNKWIGTPHGEGKVIEVHALKDSVTVLVEDTRYVIHRDELEHVEELRALQGKAAQGCSREGQGGPCECGARVRSGNPSTEASEPPAEASWNQVDLTSGTPAAQASPPAQAQPRAEQSPTREGNKGHRRRGHRRRRGPRPQNPSNNPT